MASKGNNSYWIPLSDLMTVLMVTFLFIAVVYMAKVQLATKGITELKASKKELLDELNKEFKEDFKSTKWNAVLDSNNLSIRFVNEDVMFGQDEDIIKEEFKAILADFFPRYLKIILKDTYKDKIEEVRIEGHTSQEGTYEYNLDLSQRRTQKVMGFLRSLPHYKILQSEDKRKMSYWLTANGLSFGRAIDKNGDLTYISKLPADPKKCRRVEFRIVTTSRQVIDSYNRKIK
jgi:outer membrane protein OmpA-like peptidoglycan-associated protein